MSWSKCRKKCDIRLDYTRLKFHLSCVVDAIFKDKNWRIFFPKKRHCSVDKYSYPTKNIFSWTSHLQNRHRKSPLTIIISFRSKNIFACFSKNICNHISCRCLPKWSSHANDHRTVSANTPPRKHTELPLNKLFHIESIWKTVKDKAVRNLSPLKKPANIIVIGHYSLSSLFRFPTDTRANSDYYFAVYRHDIHTAGDTYPDQRGAELCTP